MNKSAMLALSFFALSRISFAQIRTASSLSISSHTPSHPTIRKPSSMSLCSVYSGVLTMYGFVLCDSPLALTPGRGITFRFV